LGCARLRFSVNGAAGLNPFASFAACEARSQNQARHKKLIKAGYKSFKPSCDLMRTRSAQTRRKPAAAWFF